MVKFLGFTLILCFLQIFCFAQTSEIHDVFNQFKKFVTEKNSEEVLKMVDKETIDYYGTLLKLALNADKKTLKQRRLLDQISVLIFRHKIPSEQILKMNKKTLFTYAVKNGFLDLNNGGITPHLTELNPGKVNKTNHISKMKLLQEEKQTILVFSFRIEDGKWKVSLLPYFKQVNNRIVKNLKHNKIDWEEWLFISLLANLNLKTVDMVKIWEPVVEK